MIIIQSCNIIFILLSTNQSIRSLRSMKRARDVRDQLEGLMERVEIESTSNLHDNIAIRKVDNIDYFCPMLRINQ